MENFETTEKVTDRENFGNPATTEAPNNTQTTTSTDADIDYNLSDLSVPANHQKVNSETLDLEELRLEQDYEEPSGVKKVPSPCSIKKPSKHAFFRVRSGEKWTYKVMIFEGKEQGETYIVHPQIANIIHDLIKRVVLYLAITRDGELFLLPVRLPKPDGRSDSWLESLERAVELAKSKWVRISANMNEGRYNVYEAIGNLPDPTWPNDLTFDDILNKSFNGRVINNKDHPVVKKALGEI